MSYAAVALAQTVAQRWQEALDLQATGFRELFCLARCRSGRLDGLRVACGLGEKKRK